MGMSRGATVAAPLPVRPSLDRVVVINDECVERGGAAGIALSSVRSLRRLEIPVTFLCGDDGANPELEQLGVDVVPLGGRHIMNGMRGAAAARGLFDRTTLSAIRGWIDTNDTAGTVYHLHNWHKVLSPSIFAALSGLGSRLLVSAHDYFLACPNGGFFHYPRGHICALTPASAACVLSSCDRRHYGHKLWRLARHQVRRAVFDLGSTPATIIAVHDGMIPYLQRAGIPARSIRVLRNPVTPWRSARVAAESNRDVFFVGRLEKDKGVDLLARAARRAGARLRIIGDGPLRQELSRDHPEVELLGWRSRQEIGDLIGEARMLVVPTRWPETFGLVSVEALTSGLPVIMSRFSLISGEVVRLGLGLACDPHDEAELAAAIRRFGEDDSEVKSFSHRAFADARQLAPTPERWCADLIGLYEDALQRSAELAFGVNSPHQVLRDALDQSPARRQSAHAHSLTR